MTTIYVLLLENDKYYIGKTKNINFRLDNHFNSIGSSWTLKYKPLKIVEKIDNCEDFDEDKYTLKYMNKYGINNVRGGSFCQLVLSDSTYKTLTKMLNNNNDKCFYCGSLDHFVKDCDKKSKRAIKHVQVNNKTLTCTYIDGICIEKIPKYTNNENVCIIECYLNKSIGWNLFDNISLSSVLSPINKFLILEWVNDDHFRIRHPDKNIYATSDLYSSTKKQSGLFKIEDKQIINGKIECYISTNNNYLWIDEKWHGYYLQNNSNNKGKWEKFFITLLS